MQAQLPSLHSWLVILEDLECAIGMMSVLSKDCHVAKPHSVKIPLGASTLCHMVQHSFATWQKISVM